MVNIHPDQTSGDPWKDDLPSLQTLAYLTRAYGAQTLAFPGLMPENEHFIAPGGIGLVNYRLTRGVAVVLGDPICAPEAVEQVTRSFLAYCASRHWHVAFYQVCPDALATYRALNLRPRKMGEEALLFPQSFTLQGSALANVRTSCRRAERAGVQIEWYEGVPSAAVMQQLTAISTAWLASKGAEQEEEAGFSTGRLNEVMTSAQKAGRIAAQTLPDLAVQPAVPRLVIGVALTDVGEACAFVTFTPIYGTAAGCAEDRQGWGWALDLMRRVPTAPPGVMDLLLVRALERFRVYGAHRVSLGLVAMADTGREMAAVERRLVDFASKHIAPFSHRQTLFSFKQKFNPCWESRYLVADTTLALPNIALAVLRLRNYRVRPIQRLQHSSGIGWQSLRYGLVGGANTLVDMLILNILLWRLPTHSAQSLVLYNSLAYMGGAVNSFFWNRYWTFRRKQRPTLREAGRFVLSMVLEILVSNGLVWLAGIALSPLIANNLVWGNASKLLAVAVNAVFTYICMRCWIFAD